ncbi:putative DNA-directed RNA polymerase, omega subunit [Porphyromonas sp. oral taxon 278 str. W7784]|uniref:N-6 DNA methylase n=1 Tax=Porphyromonas sp. oral taxon 278 TaxID=712437 RepID=UPI0003ACE1EA|nr:N-6 DNA methylase [Porphyromonas sp. oral taxon 278]ERJ71799.1 putative DNA-directed RNA polymerase, omega subunit [Porphyromonas sp. oral taxon 278 str. W7784]
MITIDNLRPLLVSLGYEQTKGITEVWARSFGASSSEIAVDFGCEAICYPEDLKIHRKTTTNFSQPENFVVLECITRLLSLGYTPQQLELEKPTPKGHGESGGHCDIIIQNNEGEVFALVECKTMDSTKSGDEFSRAWSYMEEDGGQLFNYFNTFRQATALCLYASDWVEGRCVYQSRIVSIQDNEGYIQASGLPGYASVEAKKGGKESYFKVWRDTYDLDYSPVGLFEEGTKPFTIGMRVLRAEDLKDADGSDIQKKYHEYATIMRQHNVSGRENAFDKLVNLFLAKIVDETRNGNALKFHWGGAATDDYYSLQDRLQKMYSEGMNEFLGEQVTYIDEQQISYAFTHYLGKLDATKDAVLQYFRQQKFYTNNDFAFLDVHNETLFRQNAEILKKVVGMLQDIRLRTEKPNQFLGDLFEGFLDQGVKQNEGQFFTPLPIVRFIVSSLPLETLHAERAVPKVIDYACGAGHFLNEYAQQVKPFISALGVAEQDCYNAIYGIEKEYRLSKVAKVSAFMYGQEGINIIYQDALKKHERIKEGSYSVLIANPPYSVKGFLETLTEEERLQYELNIYVSDISANNSIEVFFLERASQLLRSGGVAAIILPSSVLSNGNIYSRAREQMLREFQIVAIAEFGSGTFGKTGTNTVTLFLKKRDTTVPAKEHYHNRVKTWFGGDFASDDHYQDIPLLDAYCRMQGIDRSLYDSLLCLAPVVELWNHELFKSYRAKFAADSEAKRILKKKLTKKYTREMQTEELEKYILTAIRELEQEKLYYYLLAKSNEQPVLIIKSPADNAANKRFLGYEWSSRKGDEGIKYIGGATKSEGEGELSLIKGIDSIQTPLFNPRDLSDTSRINSLVRSCFLGEAVSIPEELKSYCSTFRLIDMLDFKRTDWDAAIRTVVVNSEGIQSSYPVYSLGEIVDVRIGGTPSRQIPEYFRGDHPWVSIAEMNGGIITQTKEQITDKAVEKSNVKLIPKGTTLLSFKLSIGKTAIAGVDLYTNEAIAGLIPRNSGQVLDCYLHCFFSAGGLNHSTVGNKAFGKSLNKSYLENDVQIPLPPMEIQQVIVDECAVVDAEYESSRVTIDDCREKIGEIFLELDTRMQRGVGIDTLRVDTICEFNPSKRELAGMPLDTVVSFLEMASVSNDGFVEGGQDRILQEVIKGSYTYFRDGDIIIAKITPCMENGKCALLSGLTNGIGFGSSEFHVFRNKNAAVRQGFLFHFLNREIIRKQAEQRMTGASGHRRVPIDFYRDLSIPVPSIQEQDRIIQEIGGYEAEIRKAEAVMQGAEARKSAILKKYLE